MAYFQFLFKNILTHWLQNQRTFSKNQVQIIWSSSSPEMPARCLGNWTEKQSLKMGRFSSLSNTFFDTHTHKNTNIQQKHIINHLLLQKIIYHLIIKKQLQETSNEIRRADLCPWATGGGFFHVSWRWMTCQKPGADRMPVEDYQFQFHHFLLWWMNGIDWQLNIRDIDTKTIKQTSLLQLVPSICIPQTRYCLVLNPHLAGHLHLFSICSSLSTASASSTPGFPRCC